jgi:DNA invertase Pin-like site-specific DNA recombinase
MRLTIYTRVSTDRQAEEGFGLRVQETACRRWAKAHKHRIVDVFRDEGVSGSNGVEDRVGLHAALQTLADGAGDGVVVARLDRLARALTVQEAVLAKAWALGGALFTADAGEVLRDDPDDPMRTAVRQIIGVISELDAKLIAKRLRDGRRAKGDAGGFAFGSPPFGFRSEDGVLVPDDDEQVVLERITELHRDGRSLREIAAVLTDEGYQPKRSTRWHPQSLSRIVGRLDA